jgi:hypothetical protein
MNNSGSDIFNRDSRVLSIDVFRGLTILVMIFVNDVASVKGLPSWTYHIPPGEQGMTYVDVVFPAFLFIVGMAIPLAIEKRTLRGDTIQKMILHIVIRSLSLVAIGLLIMNGRDLDPETSGISYPVWNVLMFVGVILVWNRYPFSEGHKKMLSYVLKATGVILLVFLLFIYRRVEGNEVVWMDLTNWSILGGIGWAYLSVSVLYLILRGRFWPLFITLILLVSLNVATKAGMVDFINTIPRIIWPVGSGSLATIVMSGLLLAKIFVNDRLVTDLSLKIGWGMMFAISLFMAGWLLMPYGLAKIGSTPSYTLFSSAFCMIIFILMYWIVDIKGISDWATIIKPAGSNPLLTYILPDIYYAIFGLYHFANIAGEGIPGVVRALVFSFFILGISALLTRLKIRLQL